LGESAADLERFLFHLRLYFKQNRYRDILRKGLAFQSRLSGLSDEDAGYMIQVFQFLGDAYQKVGNLYDAEDMYKKALNADGTSMKTLLKLRRNHERLNNEKGLADLGKQIVENMAPKVIIGNEFSITKERNFMRRLGFDGRRIVLNLEFVNEWKDRPPLLSIFFNDTVVWEGYLQDVDINLSIDSEEGDNLLVVTTANRPVQLRRITWENE